MSTGKEYNVFYNVAINKKRERVLRKKFEIIFSDGETLTENLVLEKDTNLKKLKNKIKKQLDLSFKKAEECL